MGEKKVNKWVFMLLATLFNLALVLGLFVVLMVISSLICNALSVPETLVVSVRLVVVVGSFSLSCVI